MNIRVQCYSNPHKNEIKKRSIIVSEMIKGTIDVKHAAKPSFDQAGTLSLIRVLSLSEV